MDPVTVGITVFVCAFGGVLGGVWLRSRLPDHHLSDESRDAVKLGIGLIATMTALLLGLVTASAKTSFDSLNASIKVAAVDVLSLDRILAQYGPETTSIRKALKGAIEHRVATMWPKGSSRSSDADPFESARATESLEAALRHLSPQTDDQKWLQAHAVDLGETLLNERWRFVAGVGASVPIPFLAILTFWLVITFGSFGLFAPRNATVFSMLLVCAVSVGGAVFLVLEMETPFEGMITVSPAPMEYVLAHLGE